MKKVKALVLLSGGLDSMLTAKILAEQGIAVTGIVFVSNFYNADRALRAAEQINIPLKIIDISAEMFELVKHPPSGHGKNLNPCLDCHALMVRKAAEFLENQSHPVPPLKKERGIKKILRSFQNRPSSLMRRRTGGGGYDIIATGETLGQRPFSQNKQSLSRVIKLSGVEIIRPLSAKLLAPTRYEKEGLVDREKLLDISGRGRERQIELAKKFGIKEYPASSGGCMLTESGWSEKLAGMLTNWPDCDIKDVELLKNGRAFWMNLKTGIIFKKKIPVLIMVGRDQNDNNKLERLADENDIKLELKNEVGPKTVMRIKSYKLFISDNELKIKIPAKLDIGKLNLEKPRSKKEVLKIVALFTGWHAVKTRGKKVIIKFFIN